MLKQNNNRAPGKRLLLLTDHHEIVSLILSLQAEGYIVEHQNSDSFDINFLCTLTTDAILIDLDNPTIESVSICQNLRSRYSGPILFLTAPTNEYVQMLGLELGADDFLCKPVPEVLLLTKLRSQLRRAETGSRSQNAINLGELTIDSSRREVQCQGKTVPLTDREFDLLWIMAQNVRNILSRDQIHKHLYNREYNGFDRSIDIYISRIRQKIGDDPHNPRYLKTIRGAGYLLVENHA